MQGLGVEESSEVLVVKQPAGESHAASSKASREEPPRNGAGLPSEREAILAEVRRLEAELDRYRAHATRTSELFDSATHYAEWVRENARREAELALQKARERVELLGTRARKLERTEAELASRRDELARLQALTDETRTRLSTFLATGLQALTIQVAVGNRDGAKLDHQGTVLAQFATSVSAGRPEVDPER